MVKFCKCKQGRAPRFLEPETARRLPGMRVTRLPTGRWPGSLRAEPGRGRRNRGDRGSARTPAPALLIPRPHPAVLASVPLLRERVDRDVRHAVTCKRNRNFRLLGNDLTMAQTMSLKAADARPGQREDEPVKACL